MEKKNIALSIITLIALALAVGYVSYSIISMGITNDEYNVLASTSNGLVFTSVGGKNFSNNVTDESMKLPDNDKVVSTTSDTVNITLTTDAQKAICCSYDIEWIWDGTTEAKNQYTKSTTSDSKNEFEIVGSYSVKYDGTEGPSVALDNNGKFTKQLPNYNAEEKTVYNTQICNQNTTTLSKEVVQSYTLETKFYNLKDTNQDALKGKTFKGHIEIANIKCTKKTD